MDKTRFSQGQRDIYEQGFNVGYHCGKKLCGLDDASSLDYQNLFEWMMISREFTLGVQDGCSYFVAHQNSSEPESSQRPATRSLDMGTQRLQAALNR